MTSERATRLAIDHRLGSLRLHVDLFLAAEWTVLFGPSGSGKSTLLRLLAGLARPARGQINVLGHTVVDTTRRIWVPAHRRPVRWAGQREALFPRMTVRENVACGLGSSPDAALEQVLAVFGLKDLAGARPAELSGGQRQRVAVARAAAGARGRLLLLDEPFSGLDAGVRRDLIAGLRTWLGDTPVISVTHDVAEAFLLDAEVVRIDAGRVLAQGAAHEVLAEQRERLRLVLQ